MDQQMKRCNNVLLLLLAHLDSGDFGDDIDFGYSDKSYSDKPQNVSLEPSSTTSVIVRWEPPFGEAPYGALIGYRIKIKFKNSKNNKKQETINVEPNRHFFELTKLEKGTAYLVKMWAVFSNGTGPSSDWVSVETLQKDLDESEVPDKPTSLRAKVDSNSIHITWGPPSKKKNILVKGYKVGWGIGVPDVFEKVIEGDAQRSFTIHKLQSSAQYVISVRAFNRMGDGLPAYETGTTTSESAAEAQTPMLPPVGLKATVVSSSSIMLDWTDTGAGAGGSSKATSSAADNRWYLVRYTGNVHSSSPKYRYMNSSTPTCMIEDLKANTQYEFAVRVIKNKRNSTWSMSVLNTTGEAVPSTAPRDLTVVASSSSGTAEDDPSTPPKQPNGQITGYVIFYTTDNTQQDRDWAVKVIVGDKLNAVLTELQPSALYYFKIQARNNKGYGPLSAETSFRTLPAALKVKDPDSKDVSISLFMLAFILIFIIVCILLFALFRMYGKNQKETSGSGGINNRKKGGYLPAATSPGGKNINSRLNNTRELKPPDLWINHNEQVELKSIEKGGHTGGGGAGGGAGNPGNESPILSRYHDGNSFAKIKKTNSTYGVNSSLYDDINKPPTSPTDNVGGAMATMRRSSTIRTTKQSTIGPGTGGCLEHALSNGIINLEPSTGLSRPLYPKTQFNALPRGHLNLDAIDHHNHHHHHHHSPSHGTSSSSPHSVISNNTVLTNSSTATNITNSSTSPPNTSIYMASKRPPGASTGHALKSFGVPTPPPPLPSLATLSSLQNGSQNNIYNTSVMPGLCSPSKKFLLTTTNNLNSSHMCGSNSTLASTGGKACTHFSDDHSISASFNEDLNQEMANLDSLMKDLNALKQSSAYRPLISVYSEKSESTGTSVKLPVVFRAPIRTDIVNYVHTNIRKNRRQPHGVSKEAGHQTSAESWGTGRAVARIPRVRGGGTHRSGQGAFGNMCRGGRMFGPIRVWRRWHRKVNRNQRRYAVVSAIAASAVPALVMSKGHSINEVPEFPLVVSDKVQEISKTKQAVEFLKKVNAWKDVERVYKSKRFRAGKGKLRNRRRVQRLGPVVVYGNDSGLTRGFRNIPGVETINVEKLNLLRLAPGGNVGRFIIWTESAFRKLDEIYGTWKAESKHKRNYNLPQPKMANTDLSRILKSDEIQSCQGDPPWREAKPTEELGGDAPSEPALHRPENAGPCQQRRPTTGERADQPGQERQKVEQKKLDKALKVLGVKLRKYKEYKAEKAKKTAAVAPKKKVSLTRSSARSFSSSCLASPNAALFSSSIRISLSSLLTPSICNFTAAISCRAFSVARLVFSRRASTCAFSLEMSE
ncbi:60S ribosomal protein L4 [Tyrophagus putrescentiae]|nr:60S ribosomal protein L4 [Tyrophagus putrescentiae]